MSMKSLMSAAHAAGYAMVAEEQAESPAVMIAPKRQSTALVVHPAYQPSFVRKMQRSLVRLWLREWAAMHGARRAAA